MHIPQNMKSTTKLLAIATLAVITLLGTSCHQESKNDDTNPKRQPYKPVEALKEPSRLEKMGMTEKQVHFADDTPEQQRLIVPAAQMINQGSYKSAVETLDKYLLLRTDRPIAYLMKGYALTEIDQHGQALGSLMQVLSMTPENNYARMLKGMCHLKLNQLPEAYAAFGMVIRKEPNNMLAYYNRGQVLAFMQKYKEAIADFDKAIVLSPDYAPAYNNRGNTKFLAGDKEGACSDWKTSMEMGNTASEKSYLKHCRK